jgi:hypothetical protein
VSGLHRRKLRSSSLALGSCPRRGRGLGVFLMIFKAAAEVLGMHLCAQAPEQALPYQSGWQAG